MSASPDARRTPIVPFWNRLRAISLYPAHMAALVPIVMFALGKMLGFLPVLGFILALLVTVAMYRYAFDCLVATANGRLQPPETSFTDGDGPAWRFIGLMIIFLVFIVLCAIVLGPQAAQLAGLLLGLALPGATITLALEDSLLAALNPAKWLGIVTRIGWPYLAAAGLCLVVFASQRYAAGFAAAFLPMFLAIIVATIVSNYALVLTFHLLGYLVYQYHEELGFAPQNERLGQALGKPDPDQEILDEAADLVRDGKPEVAIEVLRAHLNRGGTQAVHSQYRKLLHLRDDKQALLQHGQEYLPILLAWERYRDALRLVDECQAIDAGFAPPKAEQVTDLARLAARSGQPAVALRLLSGFHKRFPTSPDIAENYLLVATLLHERFNQDDKARKLLHSLKANYPDSPLMPQIDSCLASVERMLAATSTAAEKPGASPAT